MNSGVLLGPVCLLILSAWISMSCSDDKEIPTSSLSSDGWNLVWSDDFNGSTLDRSKWRIREANPGWINNELQRYTARPENVRVENGNLVLEARRDWFNGAEYSSGRVESGAIFTHGKIEARIKLPGGIGTWPAFFLLPTDQTQGWPRMGEFDIMEEVGFDPDTILAAHHSHSAHPIGTIHIPRATEGFHTYSAEWYPDHIDAFVDGVKFFTTWNQNTGTDQWPFNKDYFINLNVAVGGNWGGQHGVDPNIWPRQMLVDYVRLYKR